VRPRIFAVFRLTISSNVPTLGLAFASLVAERLGLSRYVPPGYSREQPGLAFVLAARSPNNEHIIAASPQRSCQKLP
jgi:hypothetical protein